MLVAINWLKELVEINKPIEEVAQILSDKTVGVKELTESSMELDMKGYNRADLLSLRGVAYEVRAIIGASVKFQESSEDQYYWVDKKLDDLKIEVEDEKKCPLYTITKIEGLKVAPSPKEWVEKLEASGIRSINNVADVTNLIMLEFGQPMHAFDAEIISDEQIIVRNAKSGEKLTTLDGKVRNLEESDLLITDPDKAVGLAGVMGGKNSEITDETKTVLLEAAIFDPVTLRRTATRLGFQSEASKRFYHGLTKKRLFQALDAAIRLYEGLGGKITGLKIVGETADQLKKIPLRLRKINELIGILVGQTEVKKYLEDLNFVLSDKVLVDDQVSWVVTPPYYRLDIEVEEDLIEEVARMYGYEKIPSIKLPEIETVKADQSQFELIDNIKKTLFDLGLTEVQTYSFYSTQILENLGWNDQANLKNLVKIKNPISAETEYMRMTVWPNLLEVAARNIKNGVKDIAIFEVGKMYGKDEGGKITEGYELAIVISEPKNESLAVLYQIYKELAKLLGLPDSLEATVVPSVVKQLFHPNKFLPILKNGKQVGGFSEIHPRIIDKFGISQRVAVLGINLEML